MPRRRRPRPVASAGVEALLLRSEELAKGWPLAPVEDAPLERAAAILAGEVARHGPRIRDAAVRATFDEADLRRIEREGVLEPLASRTGEMAGAESAGTAAHAVETLTDVVWSALRSELSQEEPELLADAAERLSPVVELVRGASCAGGMKPTRRTVRGRGAWHRFTWTRGLLRLFLRVLSSTIGEAPATRTGSAGKGRRAGV